MQDDSDITSSEFLHADGNTVSEGFTDITVVSETPRFRILKARRYGRWYALKCLKGGARDALSALMLWKGVLMGRYTKVSRSQYPSSPYVSQEPLI